MKKISAYIRKDKADSVIQKLEEAGVKGMTLLDANALAEWADKDAFSFSIEYVQKYSTVVKIELISGDNKANYLADLIVENGHTGQSGDGWVFIMPVEKAIRIRTKEVNDVENL